MSAPVVVANSRRALVEAVARRTGRATRTVGAPIARTLGRRGEAMSTAKVALGVMLGILGAACVLIFLPDVLLVLSKVDWPGVLVATLVACVGVGGVMLMIWATERPR